MEFDNHADYNFKVIMRRCDPSQCVCCMCVYRCVCVCVCVCVTERQTERRVLNRDFRWAQLIRGEKENITLKIDGGMTGEVKVS